MCEENKRCVWPSMGSTLNPGHSCLFTGMQFLTPILFFFFGCLAKASAELATMCKHKPETLFSGFAGVCGFLRAFCGFLRGVLVALFLFFADSVQKVL